MSIKIDLDKMYNHEPFECIHTAIGELCIFSISCGSQTELYKEIAKPISECEPKEFIKFLISYICFSKTSLKEGKYKPDNSQLTNDDVSSLTDDDLEAIAKVYVENNEDLFKKLIFNNEKNDAGETIYKSEYGGIEYPRYENESYIQYLLRLSVKSEEKQRKLMEDMFGSVLGLKNFSNKLVDNIKNTLSLGDSLKKTMESIRLPHELSGKPPIVMIPNINWSEIDRKNEERRLRPFNELADRLDQLIDVSAQATEFMIEANKIQTKIAEEIKSSSDETRKFSKKNIILTIAVIILTAISIGISLYK